ncbi:MAG: type II toxin-antitoxin system VapC family toxin [Gemmatimonadota bacterium]
MSRYCLDTSAYSRFQLGDEGVTDLMDGAAWVGMPAVTLGELRTGFLLGNRGEWNEERLNRFLVHPAVELLPVDEEVARTYAEIVVELRTAGTPLPTNDIWIAATAARHGAPVLTFDAHFRRMGRVGSVVLDVPG